MCPEIIPTDIQEGYVGTEERYVYQYPIIMKYLKNKIANKKITDYLRGIDVDRVVLYAITEFTDLLIDDMVDESPQMIWSLCDKKADKNGSLYKGFNMLNIDSMVSDYREKMFDKIIVCSIFHSNTIITDLVKRGVSMDDILTVTQVIYWM